MVVGWDLTRWLIADLIESGAGVAELADAQDLGSCTERCRGSTPLSCKQKSMEPARRAPRNAKTDQAKPKEDLGRVLRIRHDLVPIWPCPQWGEAGDRPAGGDD